MSTWNVFTFEGNNFLFGFFSPDQSILPKKESGATRCFKDLLGCLNLHLLQRKKVVILLPNFFFPLNNIWTIYLHVSQSGRSQLVHLQAKSQCADRKRPPEFSGKSWEIRGLLGYAPFFQWKLPDNLYPCPYPSPEDLPDVFFHMNPLNSMSRARAGGMGTDAQAMVSENTFIFSNSNSQERILRKQMAPHKHV